jgi:hypothetical protein
MGRRTVDFLVLLCGSQESGYASCLRLRSVRLGGIGQGLTALGKPASVVPKDYDPNKLSGLY